MGRENLEIDGLSVYAFVASSDPISLVFDLSLDLLEVVKLVARQVMELCPLALSRNTLVGMQGVICVIFWLLVSLARKIDELEDQRPSSDNAAPSWKEIFSNEILKHGRFA